MIQFAPHDGYLSARTGGIPTMLSLIVAELADVLPGSQIGAFAFALGQRLASSAPLAEVTDLDDLQQCLNLWWSELGLGEMRLYLDELAISIEHDPGPLALDEGNAVVRAAFVEFLRGAYHSTFELLGTSQSIPTSAAWTGQIIELRHGN